MTNIIKVIKKCHPNPIIVVCHLVLFKRIRLGQSRGACSRKIQLKFLLSQCDTDKCLALHMWASLCVCVCVCECVWTESADSGVALTHA